MPKRPDESRPGEAITELLSGGAAFESRRARHFPPITARPLVRSKIGAISGGGSTPFTAADQQRMGTALTPTTSKRSPTSIATATPTVRTPAKRASRRRHPPQARPGRTLGGQTLPTA